MLLVNLCIIQVIEVELKWNLMALYIKTFCRIIVEFSTSFDEFRPNSAKWSIDEMVIRRNGHSATWSVGKMVSWRNGF